MVSKLDLSGRYLRQCGGDVMLPYILAIAKSNITDNELYYGVVPDLHINTTGVNMDAVYKNALKAIVFFEKKYGDQKLPQPTSEIEIKKSVEERFPKISNWEFFKVTMPEHKYR